MSRGRSSGSGGLWLSVGAIAVLLYGAEHWRRRAARRAGSRESARFEALAVCALGADAGEIIYAPGEMRRRLRALAMQTSLGPEENWLDRCVPMARLLAVHGTEVDATGQVTSAPTHVEARAGELAHAIARVGLVWQVRAGDTAADMDRVADLFARTAAEIGVARGARFRPSENIVAPGVSSALPSLRLSVAGLTPLPAGEPSRFLVGAPLPLVTAVGVTRGTLRPEVVSNTVATWWRVHGDGILRVGLDAPSPDGLAPVVLEGMRGTLGAGRIAAPTEETDRTGVSYDATVMGESLWLAQGVRGHGAVVARLTGLNATAARLDLHTHADEALSAARRFDPRVAITTVGNAVYAAFTSPAAEADHASVAVFRASGGAGAGVSRVPFVEAPWVLSGRRPEVAFCQTAHTVWLFSASHDGWRAATLDARGVVEVHRTVTPARQWSDETLTVRCDAARALVYSRERPRATPMFLCADGGGCVTLPAAGAREPAGADEFITQGVHGERVVHAERPFGAAALGDGSVVMARSFGPVVSVARWSPATGRWEPERAVFDASADEAGAEVTGVGVYARGTRLLLAFSTAAELRASASEDGGGRWRIP